ncbi:DsbC family protein [Marinicella sp. W31]|uniref:DsbC family protein n=1 Tax=Marinicella sp. W31 TaxID=3023713 RepID=UPI003758255A
MIKSIFKIATGVLLLAGMQPATAEDQQAQYKKILSKLSPMEFTIKKINDTPIDDIKEVVIESANGSQIFYLSSNGEFLFDGSLINTLKQQNLTESTRADIRKSYLASIGDTQRINFFPENMQHTVTVFTDTDCGYCRKLHSEMEQYHALGIGISYVFFPRAGMNSPAYDNAVSIWCSADQKGAMDKSQMGQALEQISCDNPVKLHLDTAIKTGIAQMGTPSIVTQNGQLIRGYLSAKTMKQRLDMMQ